jgi:comEA protein
MTSKLVVVRGFATFLLTVIFFGSQSLVHYEKLYAAPKSAELQADSSKLVNVNKASLEELETVRGIGPTLAGRIVQYREEHGPFKSSDDLVNVSGIGGAKLQKIKDQVTA